MFARLVLMSLTALSMTVSATEMETLNPYYRKDYGIDWSKTKPLQTYYDTVRILVPDSPNFGTSEKFRANLGIIDFKKLQEQLERENRLFCAEEQDLRDHSDEMIQALGINMEPSCRAQLDQLSPADRPEIVIVFEDHDGRRPVETRRLLFRDSYMKKMTFASEALVKDYPAASLARTMYNHGYAVVSPASGIPEYRSDDIRGLDHPFLRALRGTHMAMQDLTAVYTPEENMKGFKGEKARHEFLEEVIKNPELKRRLGQIVDAQSPEQIAKLLGGEDKVPPAIWKFWNDAKYAGTRQEVQSLAFAFINHAGITENIPQMWQANYNEINERSSKLVRSSDPRNGSQANNDARLFFLMKTLVTSMLNEMPISTSAAALGFLGRDWAFTQTTHEALCHAVKHKRKTVVVNVGAGHAQRLGLFLKGTLGYEQSIRYLHSNVDNFDMRRIYNPLDRGDDPAAYEDPGNYCAKTFKNERTTPSTPSEVTTSASATAE